MSGVEGDTPRLSLGVQKGVFSSEREYPLCLAAALSAARSMQRSALQPPHPPLQGDEGKGNLAREVMQKALLDAEEQVIAHDIIPDEPIGSGNSAED